MKQRSSQAERNLQNELRKQREKAIQKQEAKKRQVTAAKKVRAAKHLLMKQEENELKLKNDSLLPPAPSPATYRSQTGTVSQ